MEKGLRAVVDEGEMTESVSSPLGAGALFLFQFHTFTFTLTRTRTQSHPTLPLPSSRSTPPRPRSSVCTRQSSPRTTFSGKRRWDRCTSRRPRSTLAMAPCALRWHRSRVVSRLPYDGDIDLDWTCAHLPHSCSLSRCPSPSLSAVSPLTLPSPYLSVHPPYATHHPPRTILLATERRESLAQDCAAGRFIAYFPIPWRWICC